MLNVPYAIKERSLPKSLILATVTALLCVTLATAAFADAGDRDLEVNAINTAPNFLAPRLTPAPSAPAKASAARMQRMKPAHMARAMSRHHGYAQGERYEQPRG